MSEKAQVSQKYLIKIEEQTTKKCKTPQYQFLFQ